MHFTEIVRPRALNQRGGGAAGRVRAGVREESELPVPLPNHHTSAPTITASSNAPIKARRNANRIKRRTIMKNTAKPKSVTTRAITILESSNMRG